MGNPISLEEDTRWGITIVRAENGWILEYWDEFDNGQRHKIERVFEDREDEHEMKKYNSRSPRSPSSSLCKFIANNKIYVSSFPYLNCFNSYRRRVRQDNT